MIFIVKYIYFLLKCNTGKALILFIGFTCLFVNLNFIEPTYDYTEKVLTTFDVYGQKFVVIEDTGKSDNFRTIENDDLVFNSDKTEIKTKGNTFWFIALWLISVATWLTAILLPIDSNCSWEFSEIYDKTMIRGVEVDREGSKLYYHYKGRILYVFETGSDELYIKKGLSRDKVVSLLSEFKKSPNLYEKYIGTKSKIREGKIDKLFPNE